MYSEYLFCFIVRDDWLFVKLVLLERDVTVEIVNDADATVHDDAEVGQVAVIVGD